MKTIKLTDDQFDTLFDRVDKIVQTIIDASVEYQDTDMLNEWEDLICLLYTSPSPRDATLSRMPSSA